MAIAAQVSGLAHGPLVVSHAGDGWGGGGVNEVFSIYICRKGSIAWFLVEYMRLLLSKLRGIYPHLSSLKSTELKIL